MSSLSFVGVGDLHLDSGMSKYITDLNTVILDEVRSGPIRYAMRNGIPLLVFYGDICHTPHMSVDATIGLIRLIHDFPGLRFVFMIGNHDVEYEGRHSMLLLKELIEKQAIVNARVVDEPTVMFKNKGTPIQFLPWPHFDVNPDALNVIHVEVNGSQWDHGKAVESERETDALCVAGHLHTKQRVKNTHYSGTLWQTSFGEKPDKYFHHVSMIEGQGPSGVEVKLIGHSPKYRLSNAIIQKKEDLDALDTSPTHLYKAMVKAGADVSAGDLAEHPNIVKVNSFKTREELKALLAEDLLLQDTEVAVNDLNLMDALKRFMMRASIPEKRAARTIKVFEGIIARNKGNQQ